MCNYIPALFNLVWVASADISTGWADLSMGKENDRDKLNLKDLLFFHHIPRSVAAPIFTIWVIPVVACWRFHWCTTSWRSCTQMLRNARGLVMNCSGCYFSLKKTLPSSNSSVFPFTAGSSNLYPQSSKCFVMDVVKMQLKSSKQVKETEAAKIRN
jgi:hypothetical protein